MRGRRPGGGRQGDRDARGHADPGGDARIDFYALRPRESVRREGESWSTARDAAALDAPPYTTSDGHRVQTASAFVLVARARLGDAWAMRQDLVHEFFHVLSFAHNHAATHQGTPA